MFTVTTCLLKLRQLILHLKQIIQTRELFFIFYTETENNYWKKYISKLIKQYRPSLFKLVHIDIC